MACTAETAHASAWATATSRRAQPGSPALTSPRTGRVATGDLDGDGREDLVATTSYWAVNAMASRNGTGYPMGNTGNGGSMGVVWYLNASR